MAIFARQKIVRSATKFNEITCQLEPDVLMTLEDSFDLPPDEQTHTALEERLVTQSAESAERSRSRGWTKLLQDLTLDDERLNSCAKCAPSQATILPRDSSRTCGCGGTVHRGSLDEAARMADAIAEANPNSNTSSLNCKSLCCFLFLINIRRGTDVPSGVRGLDTADLCSRILSEKDDDRKRTRCRLTANKSRR